MKVLVLTLAVFWLLASVQGQISPQINAFHGWFYTSTCQPWGTTSLGMSAKHLIEMHNNGFSSRTNIHLNPTCTGGHDIELTRFGVLNFDVGQVTNTIGATNIDFGQDFKLLYATNDNAATFINNVCHPPFPVQALREIPADRLNCPDMWVVPFEDCPMHYSIGLLNGNQLQLAIPACTVAQRATSFSTGGNVHTKISPVPIWIGLWQPSSCFYDAQRQMSFGNELQILHQGFYSMAVFGYASQNCDPSTMAFKMNMAGMLEILQPSSALPTAFNVEWDRMAHTVYITAQSTLDWFNQQATTCGLPPFTLNTLTDMRNISCASMFMTSVRDCPKLYDIGSMQGGLLYFGSHPHQVGALCTPASRPTTLDSVGLINVEPLPWLGGNSNVGAVVVLVLFVVALVLAVAWIVYRHRSGTLAAFQQLCCGQRAAYTESA